ncbi:HNH endonuclease [Arthrobacter jiangjiafuii]|uniref:HNH endonuclease n=1 Tax=Arthrobacter jiangjiafuii TaxID=2817475 RepID=A0A975R1Q7_9MICC|nr:HNH endonuclease signature motif containing protein [Arthrobacter jiangjiafuii]MBP3043037.1 DUF222 domain-containing protein [Arthrobacter jiangjiafuii]QWC11552.1 HNH endonuclease [Arthrobacter jiangjiafuii]
MYYSSVGDESNGVPGPGAGPADRTADLSVDTADLSVDTADFDGEAEERARLIDEIRGLEELKCAAAAAQARAAAAFDVSTRKAQARAGVKQDELGRGVAGQVALARRVSPHAGARLLGLARILSTEMPHTLHALSTGVINEWRATILVKETACLSREDRARVDEVVAGDLAGLEQLGDRKLTAKIKKLSYGLDPHSVVNRSSKAVADRYVSCRPAPDTMTYVTGLLPVTQGVGVFAALTREADRLRAAGDSRSRGQIMADTLVERVTGQARAEDVRVEVQLIMTDQTLLHGILSEPGGASAGGREAPANPGVSGDPAATAASDVLVPWVPPGAEPAVLAGYGIVPAQWARDLIRNAGSTGTGSDNRGFQGAGAGSEPNRQDNQNGRGSESGNIRPDPRTRVWLRRLYTAPDTGRLTAMDSRARLVPDGLARFIAARDQICRMPWCGAPIRHYDHIKPFREGGQTSAENIQGLCEACNQAKEAPGWSSRDVPADRHTVETTTPTGHVYRSTAPPPPRPVLRR